jgi:hypothetical protein
MKSTGIISLRRRLICAREAIRFFSGVSEGLLILLLPRKPSGKIGH